MSSKAYFEQVADSWDEMRSGFFSPAVREHALTVAGVLPGERAADIGAGTGFVSHALLEKGLTVVAVDQSPEMLRRLRANLGADDALDCRLGSSAQLPLLDGEVDHAFANMYIHHVESPAVAIAEMARILSPGGRLVITDLDCHEHEFLLTEHHDRWPGFAREQIAAWLTGAGLERVSVTCAGQSCCAASQSGADHASISIFLATGSKPGGPQNESDRSCS